MLAHRPSLGCALAIVSVLMLPASALAQGSSGRLAGTVRDESSAVVQGATVTVLNTQTNSTSTAVSSAVGAFAFPQLQPGSYTATAAFAGFKTTILTDVRVNVGQETSVTLKLELGAVSESVSVQAKSPDVRTTSPEVTQTIAQAQVLNLPLNGRDITALIRSQPGVAGISNRANTVINGGRPTWTQVTLDGINIQDNFIRTNGLDFLPNRPTSDNIAEFSITTAVSGADSAGGASSVRMITPSGSNTMRGSLFETNRSSALAANSFFNNSSGVEKPELSRHQFGGRLGGPIVKNKLFFFANYEGFRQTTQASQNVTIPASNDFYDGVFRYAATDGTVRSVNVMQLSGLPIDPRLKADFISKLPAASNVNNFDTGNSRAGTILNTAGYRFNQTDLNDRNQYGFRIDHTLNASHRFEAVYSYSKETDDRTDLDFVSPDRPLVYLDSASKRFVGAWRWFASDRFTNEVRGGANLTAPRFESDWDYSSEVLYNTVLGITNPIGGNGTAAGFQPQGRYVDTYQVSDTATWLRGRHDVQMGGSWQQNRVNPYNFAGRFPLATFGFSAAAPASVQLTSAMFPGGISATDLNNANLTAAWLGGAVSSVAQTFQVKDKTSGFVTGIPSNENYSLNNIATYVQDNWRLTPSLTVRAGLKWEYYSPLREQDDLGFLPVTDGRSIEQVMLDPLTKVTFADGGFYKKDLNNFGPNVGFAWDATKDGKTAVRGGYSLSFVNEETATVGRQVGRGNSGLSTAVSLTSQYKAVASGLPAIATPAFLSTRTLADQLALSATGVLWGIDPEIQAPQVHSLSFGIQRELPGSSSFEARYVGTLGRQIWRGIDYNQVKISPEFAADFTRARTNGYLAQQAGLPYSPVFNPAVPGSQALTVLPTFGAALLTNATVINNLQTSQVAGLADFYMINRVAGALATFMPNSGIYAADTIGNGAFSNYHALQLQLTRQYRNGLFGDVNYTLSKTRTDSEGTGQNRFEAFMDNLRPELSTGRSFFHQTHVINSAAIAELPFGKGKRWLQSDGLLNGFVGGWQVASSLTWQSGSPLSIFSGRGTFNRAGRSSCAVSTGCNTASTPLSADEIKGLLGIHKAADGRIYWIDPKVIDPATGRAVGPDNLGNTASFAGQVFFNPAAGQVGTLEVLTFDGPSQFRLDFALAKRIPLGGRYRFELKGEAFNLLNQPSFFRGDMDINSTQFGRLTSVNIAARIVQLSGRLEF